MFFLAFIEEVWLVAGWWSRRLAVAAAWVCVATAALAAAPPIAVEPPEPLRVTNVSPPVAIAGREVWLDVFGQGFSQDSQKVKVKVGSVEATEVRVQSPTRLKARIPDSLGAGVVSVTVTNPNGESATLPGAVCFCAPGSRVSLDAMLVRMRHDWRGFAEWFKLGGGVMYVLAAISFFGVAWAVHCLLVLRRSQVMPPRLMESLSSQLMQGDARGAAAACERSGSVFARIVLAGLRKAGEPPEKVREAIAAAGSRESAHLHQKISYLANIGTISPMLGLLGTVLGMIMAFNIISSGEVRHYQLAAAIAKAMVTTAAGLVIGIPAMAVYFYLRGRLLRLITHLEVASDEVAQAIIERGEGA